MTPLLVTAHSEFEPLELCNIMDLLYGLITYNSFYKVVFVCLLFLLSNINLKLQEWNSLCERQKTVSMVSDRVVVSVSLSLSVSVSVSIIYSYISGWSVLGSFLCPRFWIVSAWLLKECAVLSLNLCGLVLESWLDQRGNEERTNTNTPVQKIWAQVGDVHSDKWALDPQWLETWVCLLCTAGR